MFKKKKIVVAMIAVALFLAFCIRQFIPLYSLIMRGNWGISLPLTALCEQVYEKDTGASFHGDGNRYHIFTYQNEGAIDSMVEWSTEERKTRYFDSLSEAAEEWLAEIEVSEELHPDYVECVAWYDSQMDNSEIIIYWDKDAKRIYVIESIM